MEPAAVARELHHLIAVASEGLDLAQKNRALTGSQDTVDCQIVFRGAEGADASEGHVFHLRLGPEGVHLGEGPSDAPLTVLTMDLADAHKLVVGDLIISDPQVIQRVTFDGDARLAFGLGALMTKQSQAVVQRLESSERGYRAAPHDIETIERIERPSLERVRQARDELLPIVAVGCLDDCPILGWSPEELVARFGDEKARSRGAETTVRAIVQQSQGGEPAYTGGGPLPLPMRPLLPRLFPVDGDPGRPTLWLGHGNGTLVTSAHRDPEHTEIQMIWGRKRFRLYPPDQAPRLYLRDHRYSRVSVEAPNPELHPDYASARYFDVELRPGEVLINPSGWLHAVWAEGDVTFSVTYFDRM